MNEISIFIQQNLGLVCGFLAVAGCLLVLELKEKASAGLGLVATEAVEKINHGQSIILDVREEQNFNKEHIINSVNIPIEEFDNKQNQLKKYQKKSVILVCASGQQSRTCIKKVQSIGLTSCYYLQGGLRHWLDEGLPVVDK